MASIKLKSIKKSYDGKTNVMENLNLQIKDGEFLVLVGPSGCGKSTLLRMIAGLEDITGGEIFIDDNLVNDEAPKDRDIAMVFQNYALYPHMSVYDNLSLGLKLRKFSKEEIKQRVNEAAAILGLDEYLNRKPKELSGGQKQRVAVGRAMVRKPKVFLFDEPLSNLDAKLRTQMRSELLRLHKRLKTTIVYVTHDQTEAMTMADRIVVLDKGEIQQFDTPINLYNNPVNKFVAGFIGSPAMNFINGIMLKEDRYSFLSDKGWEITLSNLSKDFAHKANAVLGIRPEHMEIVSNEELSDFEAEVELIEMMGKESYVYLKYGEGKLIVRIDSNLRIELGEKVFIRIDKQQTHIFSN